MKKFRVYFTCDQDPYIEIKAENKDEAEYESSEMYDDLDFDMFSSFSSRVDNGYRGYFRVSEIVEIESNKIH